MDSSRYPLRIEKAIIIGDIHGCSQALNALLEKLRPDSTADRLIFLGDLFDRGPESWEVLQTVKTLAASFGQRFTLLRGNHEDYLLQPNLSFFQRLMWDRVGRGATVVSFKAHGERMEDTAPWLKDHCQLFYRDAMIQCVHAGLMIAPIEVNDSQTIIHDHNVVLQNRYVGPITVVGHIALDAPTYFTGDGKTIEKLSYGMWSPLPSHGIICIDTGCGKGGRLTAMIVEDNRYLLEMA